MVDSFRERGKACSVNISLYENQINKMEKLIKKSLRFRTPSALLQHMVDEYFKKVHGSKIRLFLSYCGYPLIIMATLLYIAMSTVRLNTILVRQGVYFEELYVQQQIYYILGFLWLSIFAASIWTYIVKKKQQ